MRSSNQVTAELFTLIGQLHPAGRDAVLGGTATRFYALGPRPGTLDRHRGRRRKAAARKTVMP